MLFFVLELFLKASLIFLEILQFLIIADVILSWFTIIGIRIYIAPLRKMVGSIYATINGVVPTRIGMIDIAPIIAMFGILMAQRAILFISSSLPYVFSL